MDSGYCKRFCAQFYCSPLHRKKFPPLSSQKFGSSNSGINKMKLIQINISRIDYNKYWAGLKTKIMVYKGVIFLSPPHRKKFSPLVVRK